MKPILLLLATAWMATGQAPLRVLSSAAVHAAADKIDFQKALGVPVNFQFGTTIGMRAIIERGDPFDVAIVTDAAIDSLIKAGKLKADTRILIASSGIGVGVRKGAKHPDISTPDAMKKTLLAAKSITYAKEGATRPFLDKMYEQLGITAAMQSKLVLEPGPAEAAAKVASGQVEMLLNLVSEIKPVEGIDLVGPLPRELQSYLSFAGSVNPQSKNAAAADKFLKFFASQTKIFESIGMQAPQKP